KPQGSWHRQRRHLKTCSLKVRHALQARQILLERFEVIIGRVIFYNRDDGSRSHEASEVFDVAMGVIPGNATPQPYHLADAKIVGEDSLQILPEKSRIAGLHRIKQTLFGREEQSVAIDIDAAAFKHDALVSHLRLKTGQAEGSGNLVRNGIV